ncbi:MAG TPA: hydroxymethylbilane synthase [Acidimicrobiales bacterium]|nr:hydroxymethylbilane synthase [Acidimicrobiales bacterium]
MASPAPVTGGPLRIATRASTLARWQAEHVAGLLRAALPSGDVELLVLDTSGDRRLDVPVWELGGTGVFVKEIQAAVLDGRADLAVHSAKDLPSEPTAGLTLAAVPPRADPRDALVGARLADLAPGATVATGSVRRRAQLAWLRPDLTFVGVRGNIATRLSKAPACGAVVVAAAALERLGLLDDLVAAGRCEVLSPVVMLPQVSQGAIGVECRTGDGAALAALAAIDDPVAHAAVAAERAWLARLGSGCSLPVGAHATVGSGDSLRLEALVAAIDGRVVLRRSAIGSVHDPAELGWRLADELLEGAGARSLLDDDGAAGSRSTAAGTGATFGAAPWPGAGAGA